MLPPKLYSIYLAKLLPQIPRCFQVFKAISVGKISEYNLVILTFYTDSLGQI